MFHGLISLKESKQVNIFYLRENSFPDSRHLCEMERGKGEENYWWGTEMVAQHVNSPQMSMPSSYEPIS